MGGDNSDIIFKKKFSYKNALLADYKYNPNAQNEILAGVKTTLINSNNTFLFKKNGAVDTQRSNNFYYEAGQTHQNYSDKNCNILNCKTLIINVLDLLILDIFRIFIV